MLDDGLSVNKKGLFGFDKAVQTFALWLEDEQLQNIEYYKNVLKYGKTVLKRANIDIVKKKEDLQRNYVALLSVEGGVPLNSTEMIDIMYHDSVKTISLTWNNDNLLAGGSNGEKRLTRLGRSIINRMNSFFMVTDVSHLNRKSFFDVADVAENMVASHSCFDKIISHNRNLTDEQLMLIKRKNGLVGLCFYPLFLGQNVFEQIYVSICHASKLGLENCLCIGSDFDGAEMNYQLNSVNCVVDLYRYLEQKGIEKLLLEKFFYKNAYDFYDNVLTKQKKCCKI